MKIVRKSIFSKTAATILPLLLVVFCNMVTYYLLRKTSNTLFDLSPLSEENYHLLKFVLSPFFHVILSIIYLYLYRKSSLYRIVQTSLFTLCLITTLLNLLLPSYVENLIDSDSIIISPLLDLKTHWLTICFYLVSISWTPLSLLLFYGYLNTNITFTKAATLYPILAVAAILFSEFIVPQMISNLFLSALFPSQAPIFSLVLLASFTTTMFCMKVIHTAKSDLNDEPSGKFSGKVLISLLFLSMSFSLSKHLSMLHFSIPISPQEERISDYWSMFNYFSSLKSLSLLLSAMLLIFLNAYLKESKLSGWKTLSLLIALSTKALFILLLAFDLLSLPFNSLFSIDDPHIINEVIGDVGGSYQIFINTLIFPTLLCLKNVIFILLPKEERFRYMVIVDLLFFRAGYFMALLIQQFLLPLDPFKTILILLMIVLSTIILLLTILSINYLAKRVQVT